jgi:hypothetical protein
VNTSTPIAVFFLNKAGALHCTAFKKEAGGRLHGCDYIKPRKLTQKTERSTFDCACSAVQ